MRVPGGEPDCQADIFNLRFYLHRWGESKIRRGNGLTLWGEELFLSRHCSVVVVFSFWGKWSDGRALGARADRSDHGFDGPEVYGERKDAAMEARSARRFYFSRGSSRGRERSHRESRLRFTRAV